MLVSSALGVYALWRAHRHEKTILIFSLVPSTTRQEEDGDPTFAIQITTTNHGGRPVTLKAFGCDYAYAAVSGKIPGRAYCPVDQKIGLGEACSAPIELAVKPWTSNKSCLMRSDIVSVSDLYALDSTDKEWRANSTEMQNFYTKATKVWDLPSPGLSASRRQRALQRLRFWSPGNSN
jgi:hypothetical protein